MSDFVGRTKELSILEKHEGKGKAVLVYGRRRVGKSTLLKRFCMGRRSLILKCLQNSIQYNFMYFADKISQMTGEAPPKIENWVDFENIISSILKGSRTIVVIDEYPFLREWDRSVDSIMQHIIDDGLDGTESTLILCGSSISIMKDIVEDGKGPLYGRFRRIMRIEPLSLEECESMHPDLPSVDNLKLYLTVGGVPRYHEDIEVESYTDYIKQNCIEDSWIYDEVTFLLKADYPQNQKYEAVLTAIADGSTSAKTISEASKLDDATCGRILKDLSKNDTIDVIHPMLGAPKRSRYFIKDNFTAFCDEVLYPRRDLLEGDDADDTRDVLNQYISTFLGKRFELFCRDWLSRSYNVLEIGKWWIDDPRRDLHEDIDIVARISVANSKIDLFVECNFRKDEIGFHDYNILCRRAEPFMDTTNCRLMMISVSGFDVDLKEYAEGGGVILVGPEEILGHRKAPEIEL